MVTILSGAMQIMTTLVERYKNLVSQPTCVYCKMKTPPKHFYIDVTANFIDLTCPLCQQTLKIIAVKYYLRTLPVIIAPF